MIAVQGICYDKKSSYLQGPRFAPGIIRKTLNNGASNLSAENGVDLQKVAYKDLGDFEIEEYFDIEQLTIRHLKQYSRLLTLGGDHSITYPIIKAYAQRYSGISILHIDAHTDLYHEYDGDMYSHACPFARIMEGNHAQKLVQVGVRTINDHQRAQANKYNVEVIPMSAVPHFDLNFETAVYISLDIDAIDPAFAPGVSHHEPGGLTSRQVIDLIHSIKVPIIGSDIVEFNPKRDINDITAALSAKMMKEILGKMIENGLQ